MDGSSVAKLVASDKGVAALVSAFKSETFPMEIDAVEGSLAAIFISLCFPHTRGNCLAVVPTDVEAASLLSDLESLGVPALVFPWWGAMPYREMAPLSAVFGQRSALLCGLANARPAQKMPVIIAAERAFLTPLPPPDYLLNLLIPIKTGGSLDTVALARLLAQYGYTRVPRVQMHGEFTLRGEVLDVFMGGDDAAYRVLFDFDRVESIKRFDPQDQSSLEKVSELLIRPLKEVFWSDDLIEALSANLAAFDEFPHNGEKSSRRSWESAPPPARNSSSH
jgi:transcription-repair coupling factor (superfamily II helicase)